MSNTVKIAIDAMGGENSPKKVIDGIEISLKSNKENFFYLYGKRNLLEKEINKILLELLRHSPPIKELEKAKQMIRNSLCYSLELPSQIAGITASQALWGRQQSLIQPLEHLKYWESCNIQQEIFKVLQPENNFTLIAKPKKF